MATKRHKKTRNLSIAVLTLVFLWAAPLMAHHAFGSEFDPNRPVLLKGKVVKVEWVNPHTWIHMEVTNPDGTKDIYLVSQTNVVAPTAVEVISNTPDTPLTSSTSSAPRSMSLAFARRARGS